MNPWWPTLALELHTSLEPEQAAKAIATHSRPWQSSSSRLCGPPNTQLTPFEGEVSVTGFDLIADPDDLGHLRVSYRGVIEPLPAGSVIRISMSPSPLMLLPSAMLATILGSTAALVVGVWIVRLEGLAFGAIAAGAGGFAWLLPAAGLRAYLRYLAPAVHRNFRQMLAPAA